MEVEQGEESKTNVISNKIQGNVKTKFVLSVVEEMLKKLRS